MPPNAPILPVDCFHDFNSKFRRAPAKSSRQLNRLRYLISFTISRVWSWGWRLGLTFCLVILVGLLPVNNDFVPTPNGVEIFVISNAVHTDLVLPLETAGIDWKRQIGEMDFAKDIDGHSHLAFGWGDQGF